jgi:DNA-binding NarL/FixJ family response regulator
MGASKAQVMLVDDHAMVRHGMEMLINLEPDMEVFAEASDGEEALAILKPDHHPDIILMDVCLKTHSGFDLIKRMHSVIPALPVLVVSMHDEAVYAERALRAGARGYVMKQEPGKALVAATREVLKGN